MRTASSAFKEIIKSSSRNFINTAVITLTSQEQITVTNANILFNGLEVEDSVGSDNTFNALGSTIINKCTLMLYNGDNMYSEYDFDDAKVVVSTGLMVNSVNEPIQLGEFVVEDSTYTANSIVLSMLDNMSKFDRPYSESQLVYPATFADIVADACTTCGVIFNAVGSDFAYNAFSVATKPDGNSCSFRDVIGWIATINGTFARCNSLGQLEFRWFDLSGRPIPTDNITVIDENSVEHENVSLILSDGTLVDTISYLPGKNASLPEIASLFSQDIALSDITITGITVSVSDIADAADITSSVGTDDYRITVANNPFITADNIETVRDQIADKVLDLSFRKCSVTCVSNPLLEAGDTAYLIDSKGNAHRILITRVTFSPTANQVIVCGADTPNKKSAALYNSDIRTEAQLKSQLRSVRDRVAEVETIAGNTNQYFWFTETGTDTGAHITEVPQEEFTDSTSENYHAGYNALFRSIGFAIRNGLTELATFSSNAIRLGLANAKHILIDTNGIALYSAANTLLSSFTTSGIRLYVQGVLRTILSTAGLTVYDTDGATVIARFGTTSQIGASDSAHQTLNSGSLSIVNFEGETVFKVGMNGNAEIMGKYYDVNDNYVVSPQRSTARTYSLYYPNGNRELGPCYCFYKAILTFNDETTQELNGRVAFMRGESGTATAVDESDCHLIFQYQRALDDTVEAIRLNAYNNSDPTGELYVSTFVVVFVNYFLGVGVTAPEFTLGVRAGDAGDFSCIVGNGLTATQTYQVAIGQYNTEQTDYAFMVGNGTPDAPANALAVTWDGNQLIALDEEATTGTDAELYSAITALGWEDEVIV